MVDSIIELKAVTAETNPDGLLNAEGGYTACVYFTIDSIENPDIADVIALGTDGGGAVESYATLDDAKARCEYLSSFDYTILNSGYYALIGTVVVRTSYMLTSDEQHNLTEEIVNALINSH